MLHKPLHRRNFRISQLKFFSRASKKIGGPPTVNKLLHTFSNRISQIETRNRLNICETQVSSQALSVFSLFLFPWPLLSAKTAHCKCCYALSTLLSKSCFMSVFYLCLRHTNRACFAQTFSG